LHTARRDVACNVSTADHEEAAVSLYKGTYRIESARLPYWDYASAGWYFVTVCTKSRELFFGNVEGGQVVLSALGAIAQRFWTEIPEHCSGVEVDQWVIMPNHVHGIIVINETVRETRRDVACNVSTAPAPSISPRAGSLSAIIRSYKSAVTREARLQGFRFAWQSRFYDHVIRDDKSLFQIREYLAHNPLGWDRDEDNPANPAIHRRRAVACNGSTP